MADLAKLYGATLNTFPALSWLEPDVCSVATDWHAESKKTSPTTNQLHARKLARQSVEASNQDKKKTCIFTSLLVEEYVFGQVQLPTEENTNLPVVPHGMMRWRMWPT